MSPKGNVTYSVNLLLFKIAPDLRMRAGKGPAKWALGICVSVYSSYSTSFSTILLLGVKKVK